MQKILLPREWTDEQISDFASKYCAPHGSGHIKFERAPIQDRETAAIINVMHFTDARIEEVYAGSPLTADERYFLVHDTGSFEDCPFSGTELAGKSDKDLMRAAYNTWADYARNNS